MYVLPYTVQFFNYGFKLKHFFNYKNSHKEKGDFKMQLTENLPRETIHNNNNTKLHEDLDTK